MSAGGYQVQVRGLAALGQSLRVLGNREWPRALQKANKDVATRIVAPIAAREAPRRSGALSRDVRGTATQRVGRVAVGRSRLRYAAPIHWGWKRRNIARNPFLQRAAQLGARQVRAEYEDAVARSLRAAGFR